MKTVSLEDVACDGGTPVAQCGFCGRTHFAAEDQGGCYKEGELEKLVEKSQRNPKRYVSHECASISVGDLAGYLIVWGCPCRVIETYEKFVWDNRGVILEFIKRRAEAEKASAESTLGDVASVETK